MKYPNHHRPWTEEDNAYLRAHWQVSKFETIVKHLGRTVHSILNHATKPLPPPGVPMTAPYGMGLKMGVPQGCMVANQISKRLGIVPTLLKRIFTWKRLHWRRLYYKLNPKRVRYYADLFDAEEALKEWLKLGTVQEAAHQSGVDPRQLRKALIKVFREPPPPKFYKWHLPPEILERAIAYVKMQDATREDTSLEDVPTAARRLGVNPLTLRKWVREDQTGKDQKLLRIWKLPPLEFDRIVSAHLVPEVRGIARQLNVHHVTLKRWLRNAGHQAPKDGSHWRLPFEVCQQVYLEHRPSV